MSEELIPIEGVAFMPPFPNPAPPDAQGELAWLDLRDLFIDPRYQRPVGARGEANIRQVIENFSWSLFSPIVVCRRTNGKYAVIDGQHRAIAAYTHGGISKVPALIISGDQTDEAKAFAVINSAVTAILPTQIWHARVVACDHAAVMLQRVFDATNPKVTVVRSQRPADQMFPGETFAIDAIESCFKKYGKEVLLLALRTVVETADGNPGYLRSPLIKATCLVLESNNRWVKHPTDTLNAIRKVGIKYLWTMAERTRDQIEIKKPTMVVTYSDLLRNLLKKEMI